MGASLGREASAPSRRARQLLLAALFLQPVHLLELQAEIGQRVALVSVHLHLAGLARLLRAALHRLVILFMRHVEPAPVRVPQAIGGRAATAGVSRAEAADEGSESEDWHI